MRINSQPAGQNRKRPTFIEEARRRQIVKTAIETIAARGFSQASLAEIARKAGISKGVISYHFAGKEELIEEILACLLWEPAEFIKERVNRCESALDKLRAYVEANFEFMESHRDNYVALVDLWGRRGGSVDHDHFNAEAYEPSRRYLGRILDMGKETGEFRSLPLLTTASLIQASIDGVMLQWVFDEGAIDLRASRDELVEMWSDYVTTRSAKERRHE
ncbi:MAG: TetR/AcrR family transcriptional regulator [Acidobacteriota bacterium]